MINKKTKHDLSLTKVNHTEEYVKKKFPGVAHNSYQCFDYTKDGTVIGVFLAEILRGSILIAHAYIPFHERNKKNLELIRYGFYEFFHPWVHSIGKTEIIVTCDYNNKSARSFQEMLGFKLSPIFIGGMPVKED